MPKPPLMVLAKYPGADGARDNQIIEAVGREPELQDFVFPASGGSAQRTRVFGWIPKDAKDEGKLKKVLNGINGVDVSMGTGS